MHSMRSVQRGITRQSRYHSGDIKGGEEPSITTRAPCPDHNTHSKLSQPLFVIKPRATTSGAWARSRPCSAPPGRTQSLHHANHHQTQSEAASAGPRGHRGRSAGRRYKQHSWLRNLCGVAQIPLHALRAARTRRRTVRMHLQGGTDVSAYRVVEAAVETLLLEFSQFQPVPPSPSDGCSLQRDGTDQKQQKKLNKAARKRMAKGRRRLLQCMRSARLRINRMAAEARSLAAAVTAAAQGQDNLEVARLQQAISSYLQWTGVAAGEQTVVDFNRGSERVHD